MPDQAILDQLLDELLSSDRSPEEVCSDCPELLPEVKDRWQRICDLRAELDAWLPPSSNEPPAALHADAAPLPRVPGYAVEAVVGRGGMGVVFRARHLRLNRLVALKMALAGLYAGPRERERFMREAETVAKLRHPNIVAIYDVGEADGLAYYTMEYVEGGTLAEQLAGAPRPARDACALVATLAGAVDAAHRSGVVHRDLKPSNVLVAPDGTLKISDFGLARRLDGGADLTQSGAVLGTPSYMAPEQARDTGTSAGPAADVYALGVILYELLTGRPPFRARTAAETVRLVLDSDPVPPSRLVATVPRDVETVCLLCLQKEPHRRYASAALLAADLGRFLRGEAVSVHPEGRVERFVRRVRRRPGVAAATVAGTVVAVAVVGSGLWLLSDRAAIARRAEAEQSVMVRDATDDLDEMVRLMQKSSWSEARTARERARVRIGTRVPPDVQRRFDRAEHDLKLVARLDAVRLNGFGRVGDVLDFTPSDEAYEAAFREAGLGRPGEAPDDVAARVAASDVRNALLAALAHWSACAKDPHRTRWLVDVAERADPDSRAWRGRTRDPAIWSDEAALFDLIKAAPMIERATPILLAMEQQSNAGSQIRLAFLKRLRAANPGDFWVNLCVADRAQHLNKNAEAVGYYQAALALRPGVAIAHNNLGHVLRLTDRADEAATEFREAVRLDPNAGNAQCNLALCLYSLKRYDEAIEQFPVAIRFKPKAAIYHTGLGICLEVKGRHEEALAQHRAAVALEPQRTDAQQGLRGLLSRLGRLNDARRAWGEALDLDPPEHADWYGYAEFCLFLGHEAEYLRARRALLGRFGAATNLAVAERTARACLLRPATGDELRGAVALAGRAAAADRSKYGGAYPFFLFVRGLAEYRQDQFDRAIATMQGEAAKALGPAPRLVLAMALHKRGRVPEARNTLGAAVASHDWRPGNVRDQDDWIFHTLRREAEAMILPSVQAFLDGKYEPRDNDDRLALLGACQFTTRTRALARLYADAFAADPKLGDDLGAGHRYNAARAAARAGCGLGADAAALNASERAELRGQALRWLRANLDASRKLMDVDLARARGWVMPAFTNWRGDASMSCVRDPAELEKLPPEERTLWRAFWDDVRVLLGRAGGGV